jgi:hypothetical protein
MPERQRSWKFEERTSAVATRLHDSTVAFPAFGIFEDEHEHYQYVSDYRRGEDRKTQAERSDRAGAQSQRLR